MEACCSSMRVRSRSGRGLDSAPRPAWMRKKRESSDAEKTPCAETISARHDGRHNHHALRIPTRPCRDDACRNLWTPCYDTLTQHLKTPIQMQSQVVSLRLERSPSQALGCGPCLRICIVHAITAKVLQRTVVVAAGQATPHGTQHHSCAEHPKK